MRNYCVSSWNVPHHFIYLFDINIEIDCQPVDAPVIIKRCFKILSQFGSFELQQNDNCAWSFLDKLSTRIIDVVKVDNDGSIEMKLYLNAWKIVNHFDRETPERLFHTIQVKSRHWKRKHMFKQIPVVNRIGRRQINIYEKSSLLRSLSLNTLSSSICSLFKNNSKSNEIESIEHDAWSNQQNFLLTFFFIHRSVQSEPKVYLILAE